MRHERDLAHRHLYIHGEYTRQVPSRLRQLLGNNAARFARCAPPAKVTSRHFARLRRRRWRSFTSRRLDSKGAIYGADHDSRWSVSVRYSRCPRAARSVE